MSSPCLSGGGRAYGFDLEIVKSPFTSTRTSQTSSPSSTISEASNSQLAISTRKCRTPRKRPNQTYNEAAALLSTAYPNVFSSKILTNPRKISKPHDSPFYDASELLLPFRFIDSSGFLLHQPEKPISQIQPKLSNPWEKSFCQSPGEVDFQANSNSKEFDEDFDAESILDEEIEEGIDSIMGSPSVETLNVSSESDSSSISTQINHRHSNLIGLRIGRNFDFGFGLRKGTEGAIRRVDDKNWWCFPTVDMLQISPRLAKTPVCNSLPVDKKKKKVEKPSTMESPKSESPEKGTPISKSTSAVLLKLNYEEVANAWSARGCPFLDDGAGSDGAAKDLSVCFPNPANSRKLSCIMHSLSQETGRLAQVELFLEGGGEREASVLRYKEKRRTRLFSKKIRYQVRKVNADRRPRMKGRFVRRPNSSSNPQR